MRRTTTFPATFSEKALLAALVMAAVLVACGKRGDPLPPLRPLPAPADEFTIRQVGDVIRLEWTAPSSNQDRSIENVLLRDVDIRRRIIDLPALIEEQTKIIEPREPKDTEQGEDAEEIAIDPLTGEPIEATPETESDEEPLPLPIGLPATPDVPGTPDATVTLDPLEEPEEAEDAVAAEEPGIDLDEVLERAGAGFEPALDLLTDPEAIAAVPLVDPGPPPPALDLLTDPEAIAAVPLVDPGPPPPALDLLTDPEAIAAVPLVDPGPPPPPLITIPSFAPNSRPLVTLESTVLGERMSYDDPIDPAWIGQRVEYAVIYTNQKNRRGPRSTVLQIDPAVALPPPGAPVAKSDDLFVALSWPAPPDYPPPVETTDVETTDVETADVETADVETADVETADVETADVETADVGTADVGTTAAGDLETAELDEEVVPDVPHYAVFRRAEADESYPDRPLNGQPISMTTFSDRTVVFDVPSCYIIRTVPAPPPAPPPPPVPTIIDTIEGTETLAPEFELIDEPAATEPETTEPETTEPETAEPETAEPETAEPETAEPETAEPETAEPETAEPETAEPETAEPETAEPETAEPETAEPETAQPGTAEPETTQPGTTEPSDPLESLEGGTSPEVMVESDPLDPVIIVPEAPPLKNQVRIESAASPEVCLTAVDTFALPPPTGLVGVSAGAAILLTWDESPRPDAAGYRIYRGEDDDGPFELLNEELLTAPTFRDDTASPGLDYLYYVTAIDDSPAQNESEASEYDAVTLTPP